MKPPICHVYRLGLMPYQQGWELQQRLADQIGAGKAPPTLLLLEHPHTFTFGRRGSAANLLWDEQQRAGRGIELHWVDRGGDVTYHGPGQLVGYPLLPLGRLDQSGQLPRADYVGYVRKLEEMLILALRALEVTARRLDGKTGVWLAAAPGSRSTPAKLASIGVKVSSAGVSLHGFALNLNPDMSYWQGIIACGESGASSTSLAELLEAPPTMARLQDMIVAAFAELFGYQTVEMPRTP